MNMTKNNAYRFNPFYRYRQFPKFKSNPNAKLPNPEIGIHMGVYNNEYAGFDWLSDYNTTNFTYDDETIDRMLEELEYKGYC